jgi:carbamoyl-phosphate synthase large subunit
MAEESTGRTKLLITGVGGPAAVSFMKAVRGEPVDIYAADMDPHAAGLYLVPADRRLIVPAGADDAFVPRVLEYCESHGIGVLLPTVDSELLPVARARDRFEELGVRLLLASVETLEVCLDKFELMRRCHGVVPIPRSAIFDTAFVSAAWEYPLIVKPRAGSGSRGILLVGSQSEMDAIPRAGHLLVQEFLPGEEYSVDVLASAEGRVIAAVPRLRMKVDSGIAVTSRTVKDPDLERHATEVARTIGLAFTANIQFRRNRDGVPCLMEVNARFPGTMPLTVESGVNMPSLSLRALLGDSLERETGEFRELAMVRYWQEQYMDPSEIEALRGSTGQTVHEA